MARTILITLAMFLIGISGSAHGAEQYLQIKYPPATDANELQVAVTYTLWIPNGVKTIRGVIVHQHGAGTTASREGSTAAYDLHWQALAKKWDCALLGPSYHVLNEKNDISPGASGLWFDPLRGSEQTFLKALGEFAIKSGYPELETVPWALWGHSGGGIWSDVMSTRHPERVAAMWLRSGSAAMFRTHPEFPQPKVPAGAYAIPIMVNPGVKEEPTFKPNEKGKEKGPWYGNLATFHEYRAEGALIGFAADPRTGHECGDSRYLAIPFLDACLALRLPDKGSRDQMLKPMDTSKAWLAPLLGKEAQPAAVYKGDLKETVWLPNEAVAKAWMEYVKTGAVSDTTPSPAPFNVRVWPMGDRGAEIVWNAEADFESGIGGFIVLRDGKELAKVPQKPVGKFGRPLFQPMTYHDTPAQPLPEMRYVDASAKAAAKHTYTVITVNSVGLKSEPSAKSLLPYPRVNMSPWYQVDPTWPQRPNNVGWGPMSGVAGDAQDNIWVLSRTNPLVQVYQPNGKFLQAWGKGLLGNAHQLKFDHQGNVWLADAENHVVLQCTPEGKVLRTLGTPGESGCDERHFDRPTDIVITSSGDVFVADGYGNARVVRFDKDGKFVKSWGKLGTAPGEFSLPHAIALDSRGRLYVADRNNQRIQVFDQKGTFLDQWQNIVVPCAFWMTKDDELWVCGSSPMPWRAEDRVLGYPPVDQLFMKFNTSGKLLQLWSVPKGEDGKERPGDLNWAHGLALDSKGNIYAVDVKGKRAQKFTANGNSVRTEEPPAVAIAALESAAFEGEKTAWHGFDRYDFVMDNESLSIRPFKAPVNEKNAVMPPPKGQRRCIVVVPKQAAPGNPWSWQGCYWDHEPQAEVELLRRGFHIAFITPDPGKQWDAWYAYLTEKHGLSKKPAFVGMSKGGDNAYIWAAANPDKVSCIYADNPAIRPESFMKLGDLAKNDVALLSVCGSFDFLLEKHTLAIENYYHQLGGRITVIIKDGTAHHPHSLRDPTPIADWMVRHMQLTQGKRPAFADETFTKSYYYSLENNYIKLKEEKTYATCRGPEYTECYERYDAKTKSQWGITALAVIVPKTVAAGNPWVFRADPIHRDALVDQALLAKGFHIVVAPLVAQAGPVREQWDADYKLLTGHGFSKKPVMEGTGTAAGEAYAWAIENPDKVSCIYGDNPVLRSLIAKMPLIDDLAPLAKAGVPLLHHCGSLDPWLTDHTRVVENRYKQLGGQITVFVKEGEGHYPVLAKDRELIVDFITKQIQVVGK